MSKIKKVVLKIAVTITLSLFCMNIAYALGDYTVLAPLPGTTDCTDAEAVQGGAGGTYACDTRLSTYLPGIFNFAIGIGSTTLTLKPILTPP